ncbi:MAG: hypothetical protein J6C64_03420 [Lachnospiraceae bacterium]|nr:hypothetical protein [Lachnospiraceae bacterium]
MVNDYYDGLASHEIKYLENIQKIGSEKGNCKELQSLCRKAYEEYRNGTVSSVAYGKIYATCMDYAYPR